MPPRLTRTAAPLTHALLFLAALAAGVALGRVLALEAPRLRPDVALRLAALAALPLPLGLLRLLTTPPHAAARRFLGEPAPALLARSLRAALLWIAEALMVPVGMLVAAQFTPDCAEDLQRGAALVAMSVLLAAGLGTAGLLLALRTVARGPSALWANLTGGGAFGPAQAAPLLYAPAFALVAALLPSALLSAVWGAKAALLTPQVLVVSVLAALLFALWAARREVHAVRPLLQEALLAVEEAHATPFAQSQQLPEPPGWLMPGAPEPALRLLARAWLRDRPGSWLTTALLVGLALVLARRPAQPMALACAAAAIALYSTVRAVVAEQEPAHLAAQWLGATGLRLHRAILRLGVGLAVPALALLALAVVTGAWLAVPVGALAGVALGALALLLPPWWLPRLRKRLPVLALVATSVAIAWAGTVPHAGSTAQSRAGEAP